MSDEKKIQKALIALNKQVHELRQKLNVFILMENISVEEKMISRAITSTTKRAKTIPTLVQFLLRFHSTPELAAQERELPKIFTLLLLAVQNKNSEDIKKNVDALVLKLALLEKDLEVLFGERIITPEKYQSIHA